MAVVPDNLVGKSQTKVNLFYDPFYRGLFYQIVSVLALAGLVYEVSGNVAANMAKSNLNVGFGFLSGRAGFDVAQSFIAYSSDSTFFRALYVGLLNTLAVAAVGIVTATILGLIIGIGRLSRNWLVATLCTVYVEIFRNLPPLLVIFFWYSGVLNALPQSRDSIVLPFGSFLNNRGFFFPAPVFEPGAIFILLAFIGGLAATLLVARRAKHRQMATGEQFPVARVALGLIFGLPVLAFFLTGMPVSLDYPVAGKFNMSGGSVVGPEFMSLYLALSVYTAAFIAEIIRSGIVGVSKGQTEASAALGLTARQTMRLVVLPQSLRIVIPPLTSEYLGIIKNTSLAVAVGYADLVAVGGTILNQTGHSIEIVAIWLVVFLGISLLTSLFMNWFNTRMALVER
ncbi:MAG: hypothetical protein RIR97_664 [Pseudomonadota bacterium]